MPRLLYLTVFLDVLPVEASVLKVSLRVDAVIGRGGLAGRCGGWTVPGPQTD